MRRPGEGWGSYKITLLVEYFERERKEGSFSGRVLNSSAVLRKFSKVDGVDQTSHPSEKSHISQDLTCISISVKLPPWLRAAYGKCGHRVVVQ